MADKLTEDRARHRQAREGVGVMACACNGACGAPITYCKTDMANERIAALEAQVERLKGALVKLRPCWCDQPSECDVECRNWHAAACAALEKP